MAVRPQRTRALPTSAAPTYTEQHSSLCRPHSLRLQLFTLLLNVAKCSRAKEGKCVIEAKVSLIQWAAVKGYGYNI